MDRAWRGSRIGSRRIGLLIAVDPDSSRAAWKPPEVGPTPHPAGVDERLAPGTVHGAAARERDPAAAVEGATAGSRLGEVVDRRVETLAGRRDRAGAQARQGRGVHWPDARLGDGGRAEVAIQGVVFGHEAVECRLGLAAVDGLPGFVELLERLLSKASGAGHSFTSCRGRPKPGRCPLIEPGLGGAGCCASADAPVGTPPWTTNAGTRGPRTADASGGAALSRRS